MPKKSYSVVCDTVATNQNSSTARFLVPAPDAPPAAPGQPPRKQARTIVVLQFSDPAGAADFKSGKNYTVTVEEK